MVKKTIWGLGLAAAAGACAANNPPSSEPRPAESPALSPEQVLSTTQQNVVALRRACAPAAGQGASVVLTLSVESDGSVSNTTSRADDPAVAKCVEGQAKNWKFPATNGKSTLNLPFRFVGGEAANAATGPADPVSAALAGALGAIDVGSCKSPGGPTGSGHVRITFAPSGQAIAADVDGPPFAGTDVGRCVAEKYKSAHVAPFTGNNLNVGRSFRIE